MTSRERPALSFLRSGLFRGFAFCLVVALLAMVGLGVRNLVAAAEAQGDEGRVTPERPW